MNYQNINTITEGRYSDYFKKVTEGAKSIGEGARTIGKKSSDLVETTRLKMEISKLEKEMENNLSALGNLVFMQHKGEEGLEEEVDRLLRSTGELDRNRRNARANCQAESQASHMPQLSDPASYVAKFCYICGAKIINDNPAE